MQVPMGLFLVTCTGTRAWTPASGPRTFLSARGTTTRVSKSVSCPVCVAELAFQAVFPGLPRTTGHTPALAPGATAATGPALSPHPGLPGPQSPVGTHPGPFCTLGHRPLLAPVPVGHTFPSKSWLCVESLCGGQSPLFLLCYSSCRISNLSHLPFVAPRILPQPALHITSSATSTVPRLPSYHCL